MALGRRIGTRGCSDGRIEWAEWLSLSGQRAGGGPLGVEVVGQRLVEHEVWDGLDLGGIEGRSHRIANTACPNCTKNCTVTHRRWPTLTDAKSSISNAGRRPPTPVSGLGGSRSIHLSYEGKSSRGTPYKPPNAPFVPVWSPHSHQQQRILNMRVEPRAAAKNRQRPRAKPVDGIDPPLPPT